VHDQVDYFVPIAREVLDRPLGEHGFKYAGTYRGLSAFWSRGPVFVRVGYLAETMPEYELLLGVGRSDSSPIAPKTSDNSIGVWRLLPEDEAERIANWRFDSPDRLRRELQRAWHCCRMSCQCWKTKMSSFARCRSTTMN